MYDHYNYPYGDQPGYRGFPSTGFPGTPFQPGGPSPGVPPKGSPTSPSQPTQPGQTPAPTSPPPSFIPQQQQAGQPQLYAVDPGAIQGCLFRFTYIWLDRGYGSFWFYPTFVGRRSVSGYRWIGFTWVYFGIDLDRIESFQCF
ncbi:hypothetical protein [Aquibacillus saliphilus]|uniref:hypothetical protein n=1 Tax=Aquibacillus saliphilus TaxID=1909422 RepID=UPI001CF0042F|nr:hypothetical protein [Aquibacillus saliphilus]